MFASCLSLIEWPSRLPESLVPPNRLEITIAMPIGGLDDAHVHDDEKGDIMEDVQGRMLTLTSFGEAWGEWLQELLKEGYVDDLIVE